MKPSSLILILNSIVITASYASPQLGLICHPDSEYVKYNYAGLWEKDNDGNLFCNYQQFMPESEADVALQEQFDHTKIKENEYEYDEEAEYEIESYDDDF